ncbi:hypothetical protein TSL6_07260 [Sulfurovum sp. TSL6]|uniref:ferritin-like domain-containing protein n=1 Tax=Sulfurovum sp. TSL6 TaxID=2826995 RepID=UPI001CC40F83|nr:DUF2202 domain-containing protein [Sulfurovum sp. TSL6]GIU00220.1 hypothetical protein TSL6_07260 [Sulfurovum sp. TSL6]
MNTNNIKNRRNFLTKMFVAGASGVALFSSSAYAKKETTDTTVVLTEDQKDMLFYIYQEEKVARDVYITLGNIYTNENTFASIQISEQRHMDSAKELCEIYGVDTSEVDEDAVGSFVLPVLQELYDTCVGEGETSLLDALKIGELIEYTDIEDLEHAAEGMPEDVVSVFESLKEGSLSHLDAFQTAIERA